MSFHSKDLSQNSDAAANLAEHWKNEQNGFAIDATYLASLENQLYQHYAKLAGTLSELQIEMRNETLLTKALPNPLQRLLVPLFASIDEASFKRAVDKISLAIKTALNPGPVPPTKNKPSHLLSSERSPLCIDEEFATIQQALRLFPYPAYVNSEQSHSEPAINFEALLNTNTTLNAKQRSNLLILANDCHISLSSSIYEQSLFSKNPRERQIAAHYAKYQKHLPLSCFETDHKQPLVTQPSYLAEQLLAMRFRGNTEVSRSIIEVLNKNNLTHTEYPYLRVLALCGEADSITILQQFSQLSPKQGPWLLALHGRPNAIEALIEMMSDVNTAPAAIESWQWLTGEKLPFISKEISALSSKPDNGLNPAYQLAYQAAQSSAQSWWYQQKPTWPKEQAMWQGQPRNTQWLAQQLLTWRGKVTQDLLDLFIIESKQVVNFPIHGQFSYFKATLNSVLSNSCDTKNSVKQRNKHDQA